MVALARVLEGHEARPLSRFREGERAEGVFSPTLCPAESTTHLATCEKPRGRGKASEHARPFVGPARALTRARRRPL